MKTKVVEYISRCLECQQVKAEHCHPTGLLRPIPITEWKWEVISMEFITGLPTTKKHNDSIMVVIDKLTKFAHFILVKSTYKDINIAKIFKKEVFKMHGLPKTIISYRDTKFTSNFWKTLFNGLGTQLSFSTTYHPQTNGQTERTNLIVEEMLWIYIMDCPTKWEDYLHLVEFSYNNGYRSSLKMSHFEVMYVRRCRNPMSWDIPVDIIILGPDMLKEMETIFQKAKQNLKSA